MTQMDGKNVMPALFNKRTCEPFPVIVRGDAVNIAARRNPNPPGTVSTALAKAVCAALIGKVRVLRGDAQIVYLEVGSLSGAQVYSLGLDIESNVWHNPRLASYHLGLIALAEALVCPAKAADLLEAYNDLLAYAGGPLPDLASRTDDGQLRELILRASDELYYFLRYENGDPEPENDRMTTAVINDDATGAEAATQGMPDLAHLLTDPVALRRYRAGMARLRPPPIPQSELHTGFVGWQIGALDRAIRHKRNVLLSGYTGTGKTYCFQELAAARGFPYVTIQGKEGLLDLDFQGAIVPVANALDLEALRRVVTGKAGEFKEALVKFGGVPKMVASIVWGLLSVIGVPLLEAVLPHFLPQRREWVDGPWTRAMRQAVSERVIVFIDEINRIPRHQLNILATVLNPQSRRQLELQGIEPQGESPSETWYVMEVHQTGEVLTCPPRTSRL